jgi:Ca2+-binding EF-hand superfamily protein
MKNISPFAQIFILSIFVSGATLAQLSPSAKPAPKPTAQNVDIEKGIDAMFNSLDKDKNKQLSFEEFKIGVIAERRQSMVLQQLSGIFNSVDGNKNGTLEALEFSNLPGMKQAKEPKPKFTEFDVNKDQKLTFREYIGFVEKMSAPPKK